MKLTSRIVMAILTVILLVLSGFYLNNATSGHNSPEPIWYKTWGENCTLSSFTIINSSIYEMGRAWTSNSTNAFVLQYNLDGDLLSEKLFDRAGSNSDLITINSAGYFVAGITFKNFSNLDIFIQRYDLNGKLLWNVTWGTPFMDYAEMMVVKESNLYIAGGNHNNTADKGVFLLKYDLNGKLIWERTHDVMGLEFESVAIETDSSSVILKWYDDFIDSSSIFRYNSEGMVIWSVSFNGRVGPLKIDGQYLYLVNYSYVIHDSFLIKYNLDGIQIWNKSISGYGGQMVIYGSDIYLTGFGIEIMKYDISGGLLWRSTWGHADRWTWNKVNSLVVSDSFVYLAGAADLTDYPFSRAFIVKFNHNGNLQWGKKWNTSENLDQVNGIIIQNFNIYMGGRSAGEIFIVKTDLDGSDGRISQSLLIGIFSLDFALIVILILALSTSSKKMHR